MTAKKIRKLMIDKDHTVKSLAEETGYSRVYISYILNGNFKAPKAKAAIASVLGKKPEQLWGKDCCAA